MYGTVCRVTLLTSLIYLHLNVPFNGLVFPGFSVFRSLRDYVNFSLWYVIIIYVDWIYNLRFAPYLGQLLVQFAALLSSHYCNSALAVCL